MVLIASRSDREGAASSGWLADANGRMADRCPFRERPPSVVAKPDANESSTFLEESLPATAPETPFDLSVTGITSSFLELSWS
jgi:hypothetical protein